MQFFRTILVIIGIYYVSKIIRRYLASRKKADNKTEYTKPKNKVRYEIKDVEDADFEEIKKD